MPLPEPAELPQLDHVMAVMEILPVAQPISMTVGCTRCVAPAPHGRTVGERSAGIVTGTVVVVG